MRCQICIALGGYGADFDEKPLREWRSHAECHRTQMNDKFDSITKFFHFCFPQISSIDSGGASAIVKEEIKEEQEEKVTVKVVNNKSTGSKDLSDYCRKSLANCCPDQNGRIACFVCSAKMKIIQTNGFTMVDNALSHAFVHYKKIDFKCPFCEYASVTPVSLRGHMQGVHRVRQSVFQIMVGQKNFDDDEILKIIDRCYSKKILIERRKPGPKPKPKPIAIPKSKALVKKAKKGGARRAISRQRFKNAISIKRSLNEQSALHCHFVNLRDQYRINGKMRCRLCSSDLKSISTIDMISHVTSAHFRKAIYKCRLCSLGFAGYRGITAHVRNTHGVSAVGRYTNEIDKYETEIKDLMTKCFAKEDDQDAKQLIVKEEQQQPGGQQQDTIPKKSFVARKSIQISNVESWNEKKLKMDLQQHTDEGASSSNGTKMNRFYCDNCQFSTKNEVLMQKHCAVLHFA